jgi:hypothetical protein
MPVARRKARERRDAAKQRGPGREFPAFAGGLSRSKRLETPERRPKREENFSFTCDFHHLGFAEELG